jgi:hypothetical protein
MIYLLTLQVFLLVFHFANSSMTNCSPSSTARQSDFAYRLNLPRDWYKPSSRTEGANRPADAANEEKEGGMAPQVVRLDIYYVFGGHVLCRPHNRKNL